MNGSSPSAPGDQVLLLGDDRSYKQLRQATRLYQDRDWRRQNHFTKAKAVAFLQKHYPQLRACPLNLEQLAEVFEVFSERADWAARDFDPQRLWKDLNDPEQQQARKQAARSERQTLLHESRQFVAEKLKDRLLLSIRGGAWYPANDLVKVVQEFAPVGLAARRFIASGGTDYQATVQEARGAYLLLDDALALCCREKLAEIRSNGKDEREVRSTPRQDSRFEICPRFQDLLPRAADEVARLEGLLLVEGCRDTLVVWGSRRWLIDGHTRQRYCALLGRDYPLVFKEFSSEQEACDYLHELHYGRRSYNLLQKSLVRARRYLALRQQHGGNRRNTEPRSKNSTLRGTAAQVAREYDVDRQTIYNDVHLVQAMDRIVEACGDKVLSFILVGGTKRPKKGYLLRLSRLEKAVQKQVLDEAMEKSRWPSLSGKEIGRKVKLVGLPVGKPKAQARLLLRRLGRKAAARLAQTLNDLVKTKANEASR